MYSYLANSEYCHKFKFSLNLTIFNSLGSILENNIFNILVSIFKYSIVYSADPVKPKSTIH